MKSGIVLNPGNTNDNNAQKSKLSSGTVLGYATYKNENKIAEINGTPITSADANGDGIVDIRDLVAAKKQTVGSSGPVQEYNKLATKGITERLLTQPQSEVNYNQIKPVLSQLQENLQKRKEWESGPNGTTTKGHVFLDVDAIKKLKTISEGARNNGNLSNEEQAYYDNLYNFADSVLNSGKDYARNYNDKEAFEQLDRVLDPTTNGNYRRQLEPLINELNGYVRQNFGWNTTKNSIEKIIEVVDKARFDPSLTGSERAYYEELYNKYSDYRTGQNNLSFLQKQAKEKMNQAKTDLDKSKKSDRNVVEKTLDFLFWGDAPDADYKQQEEDYAKAAAEYYALQGKSTNDLKEDLNYYQTPEEREAKRYAVYGKGGGFFENLGLGLASIPAGTLSGLEKTGDALIGTPINAIGKLFGAKKDIIPKGASGIQGVYNELNESIAKNSMAYGDNLNVMGIVSNTISSFIPTIGAIYALSHGDVVTSSLLVESIMIELLKNPAFWTSFVMDYGNEYEELKKAGADDLTAYLGSLISTSINSYIEIGGGNEEIARRLASDSGKVQLIDFVTSSLSEGGEEILQGNVTELFKRLSTGDFDFSKERIQEFSKENLKEGISGVIGGAFLGGGQLTVNAIAQYNTNSQYKKLGEYLRNQSGNDIQSIIDFARTSENADIRALANENDISNTTLGKIYSYMCRDVQTAFDTDNGLEGMTENLKGYFRQLTLVNPQVAGVIVPQYTEAVEKLGLSAEDTAKEIFTATKEYFDELNQKAITAENEVANAETEETEAVDEEAVSNPEVAEEMIEQEKSESAFEEVSVEPLTVKTTDLAGKETATTNTRAYTAKQRMVRDIGKALGITVTFDNVDNADGYYVKDSNHIVLDYNTVDPVRTVMMHEMTHFGQNNTKLWNNFVKAIRKSSVFSDWVKSGYRYNSYENYETAKNTRYVSQKADLILKDITEHYAQYGLELSAQDAEYEMYAKFCGECLFTTEKEQEKALKSILKRASAEERTSISDFIKKFVEWIKSKLPNYAPTLEQLENKWLELVKKTEVKVDNTAGNEVQYNISRANKKGELINRFYNALDKQEWRAYYDSIVKNGYLKMTNVGERIIQVIGNKLLVSERQYTGNDAHDFQVIQAYMFTSDLENQVNQFAKMLEKEGVDFDSRRIEKGLLSYIKVYGEKSSIRTYTRYGTWADIGNRAERESVSGNARNGGLYGEQSESGRYVSSSKQNLQEVSRGINNEDEASEKGAFSMPESDKQYSIPSDTEYLKLAENPEKNKAILSEMVKQKAYDSGLRYVGLHGTPYFGFTTFKKNQVKKIGKDYYSGAYFFTDKYRVAESYSGEKGTTEISSGAKSGNYMTALDIKKPLTVDCDYRFWNDIEFEGRKTTTDKIVEYAKEQGYDGVIFNNVIDSAGLTETRRAEIENSKELQKKWASKVFAVFDSSQIKSLDPVTYDDNGNVIPLSERFNESESDIRYSIPSENVRHNQERYLKWLYKKWGLTRYDEDNLKADMKDLRHAVALYNKGGQSREEARGIIERLAYKALNDYERIELTRDAKEIRKALRSYTFKLTDKQKQEAEYVYGSVSKFAKATGLKISDNANMWLDSQWMEWREMYPGYFGEDISEGDMVVRIGEIIDALTNMTEEYADPEEALAYNVPEMTNQIIYDIENSGVLATEKAIKAYQEKRDIEQEKRNYLKDKTAAQNKVRKLLKRFERIATRPTKRNYFPAPFFETINNVLKKLEQTINADEAVAKTTFEEELSNIAWELENNKDFSDSMRDSVKNRFINLYYKAAESNSYGRGAELERLAQLIALETDTEKRQKLINRYNRYYRGTFDFGADFKKMIDLLSEFEQGERDGKTVKDSETVGDFTINKITDTFNKLNNTLKDKAPPLYTKEDWERVHSAFSMLMQTIDNYNKTIGEEKAREIADIGEKMISEVKKNIESPKWLKSTELFFQDVTSLFRRLGNYESNSEWVKIGKRLNDGQKKTMQLKMEFLSRFDNLAKDKRTAEMFDTKELVNSGLYDKDTGKDVFVPKEFRLYLAMVSLDKDAFNHLKENGITLPKDFKKYYENGLGDKDDYTVTCQIRKLSNWQDNILNDLSEIEREWLREIQSFNRYVGGLLNETFFKLNGFYREMQEHYAPIIVDGSFLQTDFSDTSDPALAIKPGNMNERTGSRAKIYGVGAISQLLRDIEKDAQYIGLAIPMRDFVRIYNYRDGGVSLKEALKKKYGSAANNYITDAMSDLIGATRTIGDAGSKSFQKLMNKFKGNYAQAVLSLNLRVAFTQTASYPMAYTILDTKSMAKALAYIEDADGKKHFGISKADRAWIDSITPLVWYRTQGFIKDDIEDVVNRIGATGAEKLANKVPHILKWVNMFDEMTINRLAYASMFYVNDHFSELQKGSEEYREKVKEIFEAVIEQTQPNYSVLQRSPFMRKGTTNQILAAFSMFKTVPTMQLNRLIDATLELRTKLSQKDNFTKAEISESKKNFAKTVTAITISNLNLVIFRAIIDALLGGFKRYRDKDENLTLESVTLGVLKDFIETPLGMLPLVGDLVGYLVDNIFDENAKMYDKTLPQLDTINDLTWVFKYLVDKGKDKWNGDYEFEFEEALKKATTAIEKVSGAFGYPVKNAKNLGLGLYYTISDLAGKLKSDKEFFESAVEDNAINRILGTVQSKAQKINIIISAAEDGKTADTKRLIEEYQKDFPDDDVFQKIREHYTKDKKFSKEIEKAIQKTVKIYSQLDDKRKKQVIGDVKGYYATENAIKVKGLDKSDFDNLYEAKRKGTNTFNDEKKKLLKKYSEKEIDDGLEYAKVRYMRKLGISVEEYYASKKYANSNDKDGSGKASTAEKREALEKLGLSKKQIEAFLN